MLKCLTTFVATFTACGSLLAQGFNIDLDIFFGEPALGNGAPSASFGAAAGQAGHWNRINFGTLQANLENLSGQASAVTMTMTQQEGSGGLGFNNPSNTGDFALLLNDGASVNNVLEGGRRTYTFAGLTPGLYEFYTYAVHPSGDVAQTPIEVAQALANQVQIVTGPMPGNSFQHLITHSLHLVEITQGQTLFMECEIIGQVQNGSYINGFQIVPVPEPGTVWVVVAACLYSMARSRRKQGRR